MCLVLHYLIIVEQEGPLVNALGKLVSSADPVHDISCAFSGLGYHIIARCGGNGDSFFVIECNRHSGEVVLYYIKVVLFEQYDKVVSADSANAFLV